MASMIPRCSVGAHLLEIIIKKLSVFYFRHAVLLNDPTGADLVFLPAALLQRVGRERVGREILQNLLREMFLLLLLLLLLLHKCSK